MRGLDANVLVRYLVQDDVGQAARATRCIEEATRSGEPCAINLVVLCEMVWVLESAYGVAKNELVRVIEKILMTRQFDVEEKDIAWLALGDYKSHSADFADCLIGRRNHAVGCDVTVTFDRGLKNLDTFRLL